MMSLRNFQNRFVITKPSFKLTKDIQPVQRILFLRYIKTNMSRSNVYYDTLHYFDIDFKEHVMLIPLGIKDENELKDYLEMYFEFI